MTNTRIRPALVTIALTSTLLTACSGSQADPGASGTEPSQTQSDDSAPESTEHDPTPAVSDEPSAASELDGVWSIDLTRDELRAGLESGGYGDLAAKFFDAEGIPPEGTKLTFTVADGRFQIDYADQHETFGWAGTADVDGNQVTLTDEEAGGTVDVLRWKVNDDHVTFRVVKSNDVTFRGIPSRAYLYAYFAPEPLPRVS